MQIIKFVQLQLRHKCGRSLYYLRQLIRNHGGMLYCIYYFVVVAKLYFSFVYLDVPLVQCRTLSLAS